MSSPPSLSSLSLQSNGRSPQSHSAEGQTCQTRSSGPYSFGFPLRVIPPGYDKHPGPRPPLKAYQEAQRWIEWDPDPEVSGIWSYRWLETPTFDDATLLVEEMVLRNILPECFSMVGTRGGGEQEKRSARIEVFSNGSHNRLYKLQCRCFPTSKEEQVAQASSSPPVLSQSCYKAESQRPLNTSSPNTPSACKSTLLYHSGCGDSGVGDKFNRHIPAKILLRLALPLDPYFHMESDVATAHFARVCGIPVPRIYAYDSSAVNCLGIEWQLVQKIPDPEINFVDDILDEEKEFLAMCGKDQPEGQSTAWTRLGRQLEQTLALSRSGSHHPHRGQKSGASFNKIGSLYWDFEKCDFVLGPVVDRTFTNGRRILYHQRHAGDSGDPKLPLHRGPFGSVREYVDAALTMFLREAHDESLRVVEDQPRRPKSPAPSSEAENGTETTTSATDTESSSEDDEESPRNWYTEADVEIIHDQVSKLRDIVVPWLVAKLPPEQQGRMRTYISHPDLHVDNLRVSRRAQDQDQVDGDGDGDGDGASINILGEEYSISAVLDWEHTVALPDYLIWPVDVARYFINALPGIEYPDFDSMSQTERYVTDFLDGGRAPRGPWRSIPEVAGLFASEGLVPWRRGDDVGDDPVTAPSVSSSGNDNSNLGGTRGADSDMPQEEATTRASMAPPRQLTNAEVLLFSIFFNYINLSVGKCSENAVNPLVEWIQAHSTSEGEN